MEVGIFPRQATGNVSTVNAGASAVGKGQGAQFIGGKFISRTAGRFQDRCVSLFSKHESCVAVSRFENEC